MFLKEMVEDFTFEDVEMMFKYDKYFSVISTKYSLTDTDKDNFNILLNSKHEFKKYSLEVVTMQKFGILYRVKFIDHEDEEKFLNEKSIDLEELSSYPVDMNISNNERKALQLIVVILLEQTHYRDLEENSRKTDLKDLGVVTVNSNTEIVEEN